MCPLVCWVASSSWGSSPRDRHEYAHPLMPLHRPYSHLRGLCILQPLFLGLKITSLLEKSPTSSSPYSSSSSLPLPSPSPSSPAFFSPALLSTLSNILTHPLVLLLSLQFRYAGNSSTSTGRGKLSWLIWLRNDTDFCWPYFATAHSTFHRKLWWIWKKLDWALCFYKCHMDRTGRTNG